MAVYTIRIGSIDRLFNAEDMEDAKKIAKSKGWNPENINVGDWIRYPDTGFPRLGTPEREAYKEPVIDIDYSRASIPGELPPPTGKERFGAGEPVQEPTPEPTDTGGWTSGQTEEYDTYQVIFDTGLYPNLPKVSNIDGYWELRNQLVANEGYYYSTSAGSLEQWEEWERVQIFGPKYGDPDDYYAENWADFINNYDKSMQQLAAWEQEAGPEATGFTDDEIRRYNAYKQWYYQHGKPGDPVPVDPGDFITNEDIYQRQQAIWEQDAAEEEKYELEPGEAARRREEAYAEGRYAAEERYRETPQYQAPYEQWFRDQAGFSGALQQFTEREFPSLRSEFQATQPRLTGFPTREEARAEATRREQAWQGWLPGQTPEIEQRYWAQRPEQRGERLWVQTPGLRTVNW